MSGIACYKGWAKEHGNSSGSCCCNCRHRRPIVRHPWNAEAWAKGPISSQMGWGCAPPDLYPEVTFFSLEHSHGMCECHEWVEVKKQKEHESEQNERCTGR